MADLSGFDATTIEPASTFETLPDGEYMAMVVDSEMKDTKKGDGQYLQLTWEILEGDAKGRRLWSRFNLKNPNETAVKIGMQELAEVCRAVGVLQPNDSAELHEKPCSLMVIAEERNDKPGIFKNEVKGYSAANGGAPVSAPKASAKPPWKKG